MRRCCADDWHAPAQWQRVARALYEGETITVAQNSRGDIFEVWF